MSRNSAMSPWTGRYEDIVVERPRTGNPLAAVRLGDRMLGQVAKDRFSGWTAISAAGPEMLRGLRMVRGMGTQRAAVEYLIEAYGLRQERRFPPESYTDPFIAVLAAEDMRRGETVTVCRVPGSDEFLARRHMSHDPEVRPAPADLERFTFEAYLDDLSGRKAEREAMALRGGDADGIGGPDDGAGQARWTRSGDWGNPEWTELYEVRGDAQVPAADRYEAFQARSVAITFRLQDDRTWSVSMAKAHSRPYSALGLVGGSMRYFRDGEGGPLWLGELVREAGAAAARSGAPWPAGAPARAVAPDER